jgi:hypothetical protein
MNRGGLVGAENDTPSLEVSFRNDGHPPFTEREREIYLNGTCGVKFWKCPDRVFRFGHFFCARDLKFAR